MPLHPVVEKVRRIEEELGSYLIGRSEEIHGALLALAARGHVFLLSPPGAGKSYLAAEVCRRVRGAGFFSIGLHAFTLRDELFGPVSLAALRDRDALERKFAGYLPASHIAQLDEIWKAPPSLLNTLLSLLNEREFRNDDRLLRAPLVSAIVTSNELPPADGSLNALYDRILLRYAVRPLSRPEDRQRASRFSVGMRAFEGAIRSIAADLRERRDADYAARRAGLYDEAEVAALDADYLASALGEERPERWAIDAFGERLASAEARRSLRAELTGLPLGADAQALLLRAADWLDERGVELPYRTFLDLEDLAVLQGLALETRMPAAVEGAFYRILDAAGNSSVRRETELRVLVGAEAVLAGRTAAGIGDLRVLAHALWDRPERAPEIGVIVEREAGDAEAELEALTATLSLWRRAADEPRTVSGRIELREQMDQELVRLEAVAAGFPDRADLAALIGEARAMRDAYDRAIFDADATQAGT